MPVKVTRAQNLCVLTLCWHHNSKNSTGRMATASRSKITGLETLLSLLCINKAGLVSYCFTKKNVGFEPSQVLVVRETRMKGRKYFHTTLESFVLCSHGKSILIIIIVAIAVVVVVVLFSREHKTQIKS